MVKTDLEYVRNPVGYPVDVATAIPALLLSDYIGLDSIAFGTVMESAYRIGHLTFMDYAERTHFKRWGTLFNAVHLPMNQVVAGISEVGTSIITMKSPYRKFAQSCIRGHAQKPCLNCMKCFRKVLLEKKIANQKMEDTFLAKLFLFKEVGSGITQFPIKHENVIAYITSQYEGKLPLMLLLRRKVRGDILHVAWMEKWYSPSLQLLPKPYRHYVQNKISQYLEVMTPSDEQNARSWNLTDVLSSEEYKEVSAEFQKALLRYIALNKKA